MQDTDQTSPHLRLVTSLPIVDEAEMAVLGAVLLSGTVALPAIVEEGVGSTDFRDPSRSLIYIAMRAMHDQGDSIDRLTLADQLGRAGMLDAAGGRNAIDTLAAVVPNVGNLRQYARIMVRASMWRERRLITLAIDAALELEDEPAYRRALGMLRECELRFRPLIARDLTTP